MIKSKRIRQMSHAACMGEIRNVYKILVINLKGSKHLDNLGID
jgi:hypothetical protein